MLRRLPKLQDILPVFAVISTIFFGWSIFVFLQKLPSWLYYLNVGEILTILAYTFTNDLLESLLWLGVLLLLTALLPASLIRDRFAERGSSVGLICLGSLVFFIKLHAERGASLMRYGVLWLVVTLLLAGLLVYLSSRYRMLSDAILSFTDRLTVFLFLFVPLGILSSLVVLLRNLI
jgi:hypothetical protein